MKALFSILVVVGVLFVAWKIWDYWQKVEKNEQETETQGEILDSRRLQGLPPKLAPELRESEQQGAEGLKRFLDRWSHVVKDPRLAGIELDYVVAISATDPIEAKRMFAKVRDRVPPDSPLYPRIKALEYTYK